jgi:hypothetical protein
MVEETVNYRERNNFKRNDFMHLLIQLKNKVKLDDDNESFEQNNYGTLGNNSSEEGMYVYRVRSLLKYIFTVFLPCGLNLVKI